MSSGGPERFLDRLGLGRIPTEASVEWEIEHHMAELVDRLIDEGWSQDDALEEAGRRFGDPSRYRSSMRRAHQAGATRRRLSASVDFLTSTVTSTLRGVRRRPGFAAAVVLTLGLGIGANATMYGIVDRLLLSPPEHVVAPERVRRVLAERISPLTGEVTRQAAMSYPDFEDLQKHERLSAAAYYGPDEMTVGTGDETARARVTLVSSEFFPLLGAQPTLGRFFTPEETAIGAPLAVVLSAEYWQRVYGSDPDVLGRTVEVDGHRYTVIGVAPAHFTGVDLRAVDLWLPLEANRALDEEFMSCLNAGYGCFWLSSVVRLDEGIAVEQAQAEATRLRQNGRAADPDPSRRAEAGEVILAPLVRAAGPDPSAESRVARWLMGVAAIVFLVACANVANMLLARGTQLRRETAVRLALGVGRARLVAQMTLEAVLLALVGGALAVAIARWGGEVVRTNLLPGVYFPDEAIGEQVLLFTLAAALMAGLLAGLGPAVQASRSGLSGGLAGGGRGSSGARSRARALLTVAQAAMSVVLLVGAGLFVRSLDALLGQDLGLDLDRVVWADLEFSSPNLDPATRNEAYADAMRAAAAQPSIASVAGTGTPMTLSIAVRMRVPGLDSLPRLPGGGPYLFSVTPGYFETAGIALLDGRAFTEADGADGAPVAVVTQTMAQTLWPEGDALGQCLLVVPRANFFGGEPGEEVCYSVVGVAEDAARSGYRDDPFMAYYVPVAQAPVPFLAAPNSLYARARSDVQEAKTALAATLRDASPLVRWVRVETLREMLDPQARSWTLGATMFTIFGLLALVLSAIGLYAVLAFDVAQRTRELGIRTALGARKGRLLRSVLIRGMGIGAVGIAVGSVAAWLASPYVADLLYEVSPRDPLVLIAVAGVLLGVGGAASLLPGLRATRVDPMIALRSE